MTVDRLINLLAAVTLIELMLTIGLGATVAEVLAAVKDWRGAIRAFIANYVLVPAAAVALVLAFDAQPLVAAGVMVVAVCPGAPYGPPFTALAKGRVDRAVGLMVILAGSSAILAPLLLQLLLPHVTKGSSVQVDAGQIVKTLVLVQFLPLCVALGFAAYRPALAKRLNGPLKKLSTLLNLGLLGLILAVQYPMLAAIQLRGYVGMSLLLIASAAAGWLLARRDPADRKTLSIVTAVRNVGVGLVIAGGSFPGTPAVTATTAYGLFQTVIAALVVIWIGRRASRKMSQAESAPATTPPAVAAGPLGLGSTPIS